MVIKEFTASVYIIENQKVLLIHHRKSQKWQPPGGHMEENETPPEAARREILEEIGMEIEFLTQENTWINCWNACSFERPYLCLLEEIPAYQNIPSHQHMDLIYLARPKTYSPSQLSTYEQWRWFNLEELKTLKPDVEIFNETLQVIHHLFQAVTII